MQGDSWASYYFDKYDGTEQESKQTQQTEESDHVQEENNIIKQKLKHHENTISYLQTLLLLKDKKIQQHKDENIKNEQEKATLNQHHYSQISNLMDKLQAVESELKKEKTENEKLKKSIDEKESKIKEIVLDNHNFEQNTKKIEHVRYTFCGKKRF